ncbi:MAG: response regulator transcription factor [Comamonadaceae bacterium]|nr:MAG: response regulator transcription factor [Comamonadaceae bacterium]
MQSVRIEAVRVFIVAPQIVCWGLERLVQSAHPALEYLGSAPSIGDPLPAREGGLPDVIIVDFDSEDQLPPLIQLLQRTTAKVVVLTLSGNIELLDAAVRNGARGVVRKTDPPAILLKAIERVHEGELWIDRTATGRIFMAMARQKAAEGNDPEKTKIATLTSRERQTIAAVASDASAPAKVIAQRLCISEHTLRNHLTSIYSKLDVSSRLGLYAYATQHRLQGLNKEQGSASRA